MKKILGLCLISLLLVACKSGFQEFYKPISKSPVNNNLVETCLTPQIRIIPTGVSYTTILKEMFVEGYILIGTSAWNGAEVNDEIGEATKQGQQVGACIVWVDKEYTKTEHSSTPITTYKPSTTTTIAIPSGGFTTIKTPGSSTTSYIPYSIDKYDYVSFFYAKLKDTPHFSGFMTDSPPIWYMKKTDSRNGVLITAVRKDSPAYKANIFEGDIIVKINNIECSSDKSLPVHVGENIFEIYRDGKTILKKVYLTSKQT